MSKADPSYILYRKLSLYGDQFRREGKKELGWRFASMADRAFRGHDWMGTCWHGQPEHIHIYSDIQLVLDTLWQVKLISNGIYYEISEIITSIVANLHPRKERTDHGDDYPL